MAGGSAVSRKSFSEIRAGGKGGGRNEKEGSNSKTSVRFTQKWSADGREINESLEKTAFLGGSEARGTRGGLKGDIDGPKGKHPHRLYGDNSEEKEIPAPTPKFDTTLSTKIAKMKSAQAKAARIRKANSP